MGREKPGRSVAEWQLEEEGARRLRNEAVEGVLLRLVP